MPEGPEVRTMYDFLVTFVDSEVTGVFGEMHGVIPLPLLIVGVYVYGKHIYMHFGKKEDRSIVMAWHLTFGMTGTLRRTMEYGTRCGVQTSKGEFYYVNIRYPLGKIEYCDLATAPAKYGPDILQREVSFEEWCRAMQSKSINRELHVALLDQETVAGIGNYLKCEILYAAGLHPLRTVQSLAQEMAYALYYHSMVLIREAYRCRGLTISDYLTPNGERGSFEPRVYKKTIAPCGNPVLYDKLKGRGTYWVREKQV